MFVGKGNVVGAVSRYVVGTGSGAVAANEILTQNEDESGNLVGVGQKFELVDWFGIGNPFDVALGAENWN